MAVTNDRSIKEIRTLTRKLFLLKTIPMHFQDDNASALKELPFKRSLIGSICVENLHKVQPNYKLQATLYN